MINIRSISVFILILSILAIPFQSKAQTRYKFQAYQYQAVYLDKHGDFIFSVAPKDTSVIIVLDSESKKLTFYSNPIVSYDLVSEPVKYKDGETFTFLKYSPVIDKKGTRCNVRLMIGKSESNTIYNIFIDYLDITKRFTATLE